jgi:hypothetical protein
MPQTTDCIGSADAMSPAHRLRLYISASRRSTEVIHLIADLMSGQYNDPDRVIAFNTADDWAQDVSDDIAREIRRRADLAYEDLSSSIEDFVVQHAGRERQLALRLV